jgi:hypothetical protein
LPVLESTAGAPMPCTEDDECPSDAVCSNDGVCRGPCPGGDPQCRECTIDEDCGHYGPGALCSGGLCRRPCDPGDPDCILMPLPGPRCFAELTEYVIRVRNSFLVEGTGGDFPVFFTHRVYADPQTRECFEDPSVSGLLTSRIRLGADDLSTFNDPTYPILDCPNPDEAAPTDPNPCRIVQAREQNPSSLFHYFSYYEQPVEAIRFSNPFMSFVLDLVSLQDLGRGPTFLPGYDWPADFARFRRSRIPTNYRERIATQTGYLPYNELVAVGTVPLVYPVRIINAPENGAAFIVDAGGRGGVTGVRGQVIRINANVVGTSTITDENFRVR